jgi:serine/threonine protein kinase
VRQSLHRSLHRTVDDSANAPTSKNPSHGAAQCDALRLAAGAASESGRRGRAVDERTDIFALGVVLFEITTGTRPFDGTSEAARVAATMGAEPPPMSATRSDVPPSLDRVVKKCLAKDPEARWQDAGDLADELL